MADMEELGFGSGFNPDDYDSVAPLEAVPAGEYDVTISNAEIKEAKSGARYLALTFRIESGPHEGACVFENFMLMKSSEKAMQIARGRLKAICEACGIDRLDDTDQLKDILFAIRVKVRSRSYINDQGDDVTIQENTITSFSAADTKPRKGATSSVAGFDMEDDEDEEPPRRRKKSTPPKKKPTKRARREEVEEDEEEDDYEDEDEEDEDEEEEEPPRRRRKSAPKKNSAAGAPWRN